MKPRIVVIGGGVAGLAAGIHGRRSGYEVDLFESHTIPGGLCTAWRVEGFRFDGCIEWLTGSGPRSPFYPLWNEVGVLEGRRFVDREVYSETVDADGGRVLLYADPERLRAHFDALSPDDAPVTRQLAEMVSAMRAAPYRVDKATELLGPLDLVRMLAAMWPARHALEPLQSTTIGAFARRFRHPLLRLAIDTSLDPRLQLLALVTTLADLANHAAGYPLGGSLPVALAMAERLTSMGGRVHYRARVSRIVVERGRAVGVELEGGARVEADAVVAACDLRATLDRLLGGRFASPAHEALFFDRPLVPSRALISLGVDGALDGDVDAVVHRRVLRAPVEVAGHAISVLTWKTFRADPSLSPAGQSIVVAHVDSSYERWRALGADPDAYAREKESLGRGVIELLERVAIPRLAARVVAVDVATPWTIERYTGNHGGHYMTWIPAPTAGPPPVVPKQVPGVSRLYLAGMWVAPPGGLPLALKSGRDAIQLLCHADRRRFGAEAPPEVTREAS